MAWVALVGDAVGLLLLLLSSQPLSLKLIVTAVDLFGVFAIVIFYLGRRSEWLRLSPRTPQPETKSE